MKFTSRLLCGIAFSTIMISAVMAGEGKVVSSITTAGYTYVEVNQNGKNVWIAANQIKVKPGNQIRFGEGSMMTNFHSNSLNRTFPAVLFVNDAAVTAEK
ncbi:MAG TPA: NrfJ [Polaromonas sp.]|uniref:hypothetical protein n=1 Tax=Polaromonas sp. UBA4122 TaxID=1947074 RepID=UPI000EEF8813|nr:hypothetical protein [Polaromonas sp. UBA4122]HAL39597.1 NrfJ [Polaromonas sp.]